jgi:hypothetical protein
MGLTPCHQYPFPHSLNFWRIDREFSTGGTSELFDSKVAREVQLDVLAIQSKAGELLPKLFRGNP